MNRKTPFRLDGKVALVTGAAQGVGAATAKVLAQQGARVAAVDIDESSLASVVEDLGDSVTPFICDVSSVEKIRILVDKVVTDLGRIDVLVNNAGICPRIDFVDAIEEDWEKLVAINAKSQYFMMQAVRPVMSAQGGGKIINIASTGGRIGSFVGASIYSGTKGAIVMFSKSVAREVAGDNILVNTIAPGVLDTRLMANISEEKRQAICEQIPLRRLGRPEEIAYMVAFIASEECSYATGATFDVNGGWVMV